jgi:GDP-4-dehydro-6-deoxy-D-mannose reductase
VPARVLVTGAAGFAGSHLVEQLAADGATITAWSHRSRTPPVDAPAHWAAVDILDAAAVERALASAAPDVIYHCAGHAQTSGTTSGIGVTLATNVRGTAYLLAAVERHAPRARVIVTSSALVYRTRPEPLDESAAIGPAGPYAVSKLAQDTLARRAAARGLDVVVARPFNHIGPRQSADFVASSIARQVALIELGRMAPELRVGNLAAKRDFTDVRDVVAAYRRLAASAAAGECFNVCSGRAIAIEALMQGLVGRSRVPVTVVVDPARFRPIDVPVVLGSSEKLLHATGWTAGIPLEQTLDDLLGWWRARVGQANS